MSWFTRFVKRQKKWSKATFGDGQRTVGIIKHISKELQEILYNPDDALEWIDVIILAFDGAWRAGLTPRQLQAALEYKQLVNRRRKWPPPGPADEPNEHVREPAGQETNAKEG